MKKALLAALLVLVCVCGGLYQAGSMPEEAVRLEREALERLAADEATPPQLNGYQDLIKLWGPPWEWSSDETRLARYRRDSIAKTRAAVEKHQRF